MFLRTDIGPGGMAKYAVTADLKPRRTTIVSPAEVPLDFIRKFRFPQTVIPLDGGATWLRLKQPLTLVVDEKSELFEVPGWNLQMSIDKVHDLPRRLARLFLQYYGKADSRTLNPAEEKTWLTILDSVDASQFHIDRAAPHYVEGRLLRQYPTLVRWADGNEEHVNVSAVGSLSVLEPDDLFSAFAKLGRGGDTLALTRVSLLSVA